MSDPDGRPRPQYGEYATPEEQRARIARPDTTDALDSGQRPAADPPHPLAQPVAAPASGPRLADRIVTIALLAYGLVNVAFTVPRLFDFTTFTNDYLDVLGVGGTFTNTAGAAVWGPAAAVTYAVGFAVTAIVSWRRVRRGGIAFWMPLVGAVATTTVVAVLLTIPLLSDPAFLDAIRSASAPR